MNHVALSRWAAWLAVGALASPAAADPWITAELPAAVPISDPQVDYFSPGAMPSLAGFFDLGAGGHVALGARLRAGVVGNGPAPGGGLRDPDKGGLVSFGLGLRFTAGAGWIETDAGGGLTGRDGVPTFEVGAGADLVSAGGLDFGPSVRYVRVIGGSTAMDPGSAALILVGVEVRLGGRRARAAIEDEPVIAAAPERDGDRIADREPTCPGAADATAQRAAGCAASDRDGDGVADDRDACPDARETVNGVDDGDGCPDQGLFEVVDDRIVLDERILFELNRARIRHAGWPVIEAIAAAWRAHADWSHVTIEGHCDVRGPDSFNQWLSDTRAARVREALIKAGVPADRIDAKGYGATRPRDPGTDEAAHQRNRRVEFVIRRGDRAEGTR
jgi:outer membrane protein OmpA-like peptidoglycan-associated protein